MHDEEAGGTSSVGPVQVLAVGSADARLAGRIVAELQALDEHPALRLLDLLIVYRDDDGEIRPAEAGGPAPASGALAGALLGAPGGGKAEGGADDELVLEEDAVWYLADTIPAGSWAVIALIEHRWAIPLRNRIVEGGGLPLADEWIHPADLVAAGAAGSAVMRSM